MSSCMSILISLNGLIINKTYFCPKRSFIFIFFFHSSNWLALAHFTLTGHLELRTKELSSTEWGRKKISRILSWTSMSHPNMIIYMYTTNFFCYSQTNNKRIFDSVIVLINFLSLNILVGKRCQHQAHEYKCISSCRCYLYGHLCWEDDLLIDDSMKHYAFHLCPSYLHYGPLKSLYCAD